MHERFLELQAAYLVLSDPERRRALDEQPHLGLWPWRRRREERDFLDEFFLNLLRGMMR